MVGAGAIPTGSGVVASCALVMRLMIPDSAEAIHCYEGNTMISPS